MPDHKPRLEGKVAIVTGAGSRGPGVGNGKAAAVLFAREGAKVLVCDQFLDRAEETLKMIEDEGGVASSFSADVTKLADCQQMVGTAVERYGRLDILHNNVGIDHTGTVVSSSLDDWDRVMSINLRSMVLTSRCAIPEMVKGGGGSITNISSVAALRPRGMDAYSTSKAAVIGLTQAMASSHAAEHIRVNCIIPGMVYTPMVAEGMNVQTREARWKSTPLQTEGTGWDIGWAAVFLNSDEARWVTGVALPVDGGALLTRRSW
ncbi:MAG: short-chain dehydrogenase [Chloroflexi bacterium RBG_16_57_8]|nr:MAG: short-chain dehydrogenase [Chloroflexi bacterium RBG_16_57_8]